MKSKLTFLAFLFIMMNPTLVLSASEGNSTSEPGMFDKGVLNLSLENDLFAGRDLGYTNGVRIAYTLPEDKMPKLVKNSANHILQFNKEGKRYITAALGQQIYTPSDISKTEFIKNDYLYAGWLYGSLGVISDAGSTYDSSTISLGVVGPSSQAEQTQTFVHKVKGVQKPMGWDNQLKDEPGAIFSYERKWREAYRREFFGWDFDSIPHAGFNLGNVHTDATIGTTLRLGRHLPLDYGPTRLQPSMAGSDLFIPAKGFNYYFFTILEMRAVGRNIFLDGNTFQNGPHLDKRTFVKDAQVGVSLTYKDSKISYTHIFQSREFKGQDDSVTEYGVLTFSHSF